VASGFRNDAAAGRMGHHGRASETGSRPGIDQREREARSKGPLVHSRQLGICGPRSGPTPLMVGGRKPGWGSERCREHRGKGTFPGGTESRMGGTFMEGWRRIGGSPTPRASRSGREDSADTQAGSCARPAWGPWPNGWVFARGARPARKAAVFAGPRPKGEALGISQRYRGTAQDDPGTKADQKTAVASRRHHAGTIGPPTCGGRGDRCV